MKINFSNISYNLYNNYSAKQSVSAPNFCGKSPQKLIQKIISTPNDKKVQMTFDDMEKIYKYLGYDVLMKRGSHAVVPLTPTNNLPLVIPHKDKYVAPMDIKRLRLVINGEIEKALSIK